MFEADQMRGCVDMNAQACRLGDRTQESGCGALPVRTGDMDYGRQGLFRIAQCIKQTLDASQ